MQTANNSTERVLISGRPSEKQRQFFAMRTKFIAYGGARGGGKSWALRRKLVAMCLRYEGLRCLLVRRTLPELKSNHVLPFLSEYGSLLEYKDAEKSLCLANGSKIFLGYCSSDRDVLRYQGQEYDVIAIDEATQLSEFRFSIFKACLRGTSPFPRRMYLTCNPGGIGHAWVKRLFVDREFRADEDPNDYSFVQALVFDNSALLSSAPDYVGSLKSLPERLRDAWLYGKWNVFEGQFFPEFDHSKHVCSPSDIPRDVRHFVAFDYGFDMLAAIVLAVDKDGRLYAVCERCIPNLTLSEAAAEVCSLISPYKAELAVASPDLWNRRQDSGKSGFEIMQAYRGMPPMTPADDRRVPGWRILREYLSDADGEPRLLISSACRELIRCLSVLLFDTSRPEDASSEPHSATHAPEALRYAVMSRPQAYTEVREPDFIFPQKKRSFFMD
ncbi:MAG: phage terminase large subunit [Clostridia bacterium]|nr:phage terminase large subunit [Clostridia bacterium]